MKWLLYLLLTIAIVTGITLLAIADRGYVLIQVWNYTIESTVVTWLVVLALVFTGLHYSIRVLGQFFRVPRDMRNWREQRRQQKANQSLLQGLVKLAEGDWRAAEKQVLRYSSDSRAPMLNYLTAARAAHELHANERRDHYLQLAGQHAQDKDIGVKLTQAELHMSRNQMEQALASLRVLQQADPQHRAVIKSLSQLYLQMGDWNNFITLFPQIRKQKIYSPEELDQLENEAYIQLLKSEQFAQHEQLSQLWQRIPTNVQNRLEVLIAYIQQLLRHQQSKIAEPLIRTALKRGWDDELVRLYGLIETTDASEQLKRAEAWLRENQNNPALLLALGRLSVRNQLWGKARSYLEASIGAGAGPEAYNEIAHLLENMGEMELAVNYYREGLARAPHCRHVIAANTQYQQAKSNEHDFSTLSKVK